LIQGRYKLWAAVASVVFHIAVLSVLAAAKLYPESAPVTPTYSDDACLAKIKSVTQSSPEIAKPNVRYIENTRFIAAQEQIPIESKVTAPRIYASDSESAFSSSNSFTDLAWSQQNISLRGVQFFSNQTRSRRLCYLVDRSGSMKGLFEQVKGELARSIMSLQPDHYFGIVFFGGNRVMQFSAGKLVRASQDNKIKALDFIKSVEPDGRTNAPAGFESAVKMADGEGAGPDVIMFLTDGFELSGSDAYRFRQSIIELRRKYLANCVVNTVGFWPSENDRRLLESIADLSGGRFVCVDRENP
jgi:Mg-chelatase subunit ChlD